MLDNSRCCTFTFNGIFNFLKKETQMFSLYSAMKCSIALLVPVFFIVFSVRSLVMEISNTQEVVKNTTKNYYSCL